MLLLSKRLCFFGLVLNDGTVPISCMNFGISFQSLGERERERERERESFGKT